MRSFREANFAMYLDALAEFAPCFFALNHTTYAHLIPVHLRDMSLLFKTHPDIYRELKAGQFTVQKMKRYFSAMPIYEAHEKGSRMWAE